MGLCCNTGKCDILTQGKTKVRRLAQQPLTTPCQIALDRSGGVFSRAPPYIEGVGRSLV